MENPKQLKRSMLIDVSGLSDEALSFLLEVLEKSFLFSALTQEADRRASQTLGESPGSSVAVQIRTVELLWQDLRVISGAKKLMADFVPPDDFAASQGQIVRFLAQAEAVIEETIIRSKEMFAPERKV